MSNTYPVKKITPGTISELEKQGITFGQDTENGGWKMTLPEDFTATDDQEGHLLIKSGETLIATLGTLSGMVMEHKERYAGDDLRPERYHGGFETTERKF